MQVSLEINEWPTLTLSRLGLSAVAADSNVCSSCECTGWRVHAVGVLRMFVL